MWCTESSVILLQSVLLTSSSSISPHLLLAQLYQMALHISLFSLFLLLRIPSYHLHSEFFSFYKTLTHISDFTLNDNLYYDVAPGPTGWCRPYLHYCLIVARPTQMTLLNLLCDGCLSEDLWAPRSIDFVTSRVSYNSGPTCIYSLISLHITDIPAIVY